MSTTTAAAAATANDSAPVRYTARCHCGAAAFEFTLPAHVETRDVELCNCTYCFAKGYALLDVKKRDLTWTKGRDGVSTYKFAKHVTAHRFCGTCGVPLLVDFCGEKADRDYVCVNVRCVEDEGEGGSWSFDRLKTWVSDQRKA